jgi:hypothetical protein
MDMGKLDAFEKDIVKRNFKVKPTEIIWESDQKLHIA